MMKINWSRMLSNKVAKIRMSGRRQILQSLYHIIKLMSKYDEQSRHILWKQYKDHALKGDKKGLRELHLAKDHLLLYYVVSEKQVITLVDIVSHDELRKSR